MILSITKRTPLPICCLLKHHRRMLFLDHLKASHHKVAADGSFSTSSLMLSQALMHWRPLREKLKAGEGTRRGKGLWTDVRGVAYCCTFLSDVLKWVVSVDIRTAMKKWGSHCCLTISQTRSRLTLTTELLKSRTKTTAFLCLIMHLHSVGKNQCQLSKPCNPDKAKGSKKKKVCLLFDWRVDSIEKLSYLFNFTWRVCGRYWSLKQFSQLRCPNFN